PFEPAAAELTTAASARTDASASRRRPPRRCKTCVISSPSPRGNPRRGDDNGPAAGGEAEEAGSFPFETMAGPVVHVSELTKVFRVPEREAGLTAAARSLIRRRWREVRAVDAISFDIEVGEVVGFPGPNGAGKTTTLKMLSGLLYPTSGALSVLDYTPPKRENDFLFQITLIMGNRNQLQWDLPALDSFELNLALYHIAQSESKRISAQ